MASIQALTVRLPTPLYQQLRGCAFATGRSQADVVREALIRYIHDGLPVVSAEGVSDEEADQWIEQFLTTAVDAGLGDGGFYGPNASFTRWQHHPFKKMTVADFHRLMNKSERI